jgi:hypothetical protein
MNVQLPHGDEPKDIYQSEKPKNSYLVIYKGILSVSGMYIYSFFLVTYSQRIN